MGVFGEYIGDASIPEDKKDIFIKHMGRLLNVGGMMDIEKVSMFGENIYLLKPVEIESGREVCFHYNYFEDEGWESAGFDAKNCELWSNKIGSREFDDVIMAGYMLYEAYTGKPGLAYLNGDIINITNYMGWINSVLNTKFSMKNRFNLWKNVEEFIFDKMEWDNPEDLITNISDIIPKGYYKVAGGTDLSDLLYIKNGTSILEEVCEDLEEGSYPMDVYKTKKLIKTFYVTDINDKKRVLINMLQMNKKDRENINENYLRDIAKASITMPARVLLYLAAEIDEDIDFWQDWKEIKDKVYHDEEMKEYASKELIQYRKDMREKPIAPVRTCDFLRQESWDFGIPDKLIYKPEYYLSDDDRLYWYDGSKEVVISEKLDTWLKELSERHKEIVANDDLESITGDFLKYFMNVLEWVEDYYKKIFPFQTMFYEFIENGKQKEYVAAIKLFRELAESEEYKEEGKVIEHVKVYWDITSRKITHNVARLKLKRYLSVMANKMLRRRYFGF